MNGFIESTSQNWPQYAWSLAGIIGICFAAQLLTKIMARMIAGTYKRRAVNITAERQRKLETTSTILQSVSRYIIWFLAVMGIVGQLGLTSTMNSMLAAAGVGGLALGIGAQSFIKDVVAGLLLLFEDQAAVGDFVTIGAVTGTVEELSLRTIVVKGARGELNIIPNGTIGVLSNFSRADYLALIEVQITYESDTHRAMTLMREEAEAYALANENTLDAAELLGVTALNASGVTLRLGMRVKPTTQFVTERAMNLRIKERFAAEGIEIPYNRIVLLQGDHHA